MIQSYSKGRDISTMVWASFNGYGRSELLFCPEDPEAKKGGVISAVYIEILEEALFIIWESGLLFMQDNARIHTAYKVKEWFRNEAIPVIDWPLYSPNLNPIEHVWRHLKEWVYENYPGLVELKTGENNIKNSMVEALQNGWNELPNELFESLIVSMERRCKAVIKADGWYTKY
jgi:transposase